MPKPQAALASKRAKRNQADWEISSVSSAGSSGASAAGAPSAAEQALDAETPDELRTRLAKELLGKVARQTEAAEGENGDAITQALHEDLLRQEGRFKTLAAAGLERRLAQGAAVERVEARGKHRLSTTCLCVSEDEKRAFSGSKDGQLHAWDVESGARVYSMRTPDTCLCVAASSDGRFLASSGAEAVYIWDTRQDPGRGAAAVPARTLTGHRDKVTSVAFRVNSHVLHSGSADRSVRLWNAAEGSFIETLFGHQAAITSVDALTRERCVTGAEDMTVRLWKIPEESHLLLSGKHVAAIDCVRMLDESAFVSGSQDGTLALWHTSKRRPASVVTLAHGPGRWINSVAALRNSDLVASGSNDGLVRVWGVDLAGLRINPDPLAALPVAGNVNGLCFGPSSARLLAVGAGQEHRLGRWKKVAEARNKVMFFRLPAAEDDA
jgi:ribosomal RNA-processing protein 9